MKIVCFFKFQVFLGRSFRPVPKVVVVNRIIPVPFAEVKGVLSRINEAQGLRPG